MFYAQFCDNGYKFIDHGKTFLFSTDSVHNELLDYVAVDISRLPVLLEDYISKAMNTDSLEPTGYCYSENDITEIKDVLSSAHVYYKYAWKKTISDAIGNYFNSLLLYLCYCCRTISPDFSESWYSNRINLLIPPFLELDDAYRQDFYATYRKKTGECTYNAGSSEDGKDGKGGKDGIESFSRDVPNRRPICFMDEINTQAIASSMLYFILDIDADELKNLEPAQRIWLWGKIFKSTISETTLGVSMEKLLWSPTLFNPGDRSKEADDAYEDMKNFSPLYKLGSLDVGCNGVPADLKDRFTKVVELAKGQSGVAISEKCEIKNLRQLIYLEIIEMIQAGVLLRKCKRCGKYFIASNRKISYCDRIDNSGVRCSVVGPQQTFQKKLGEDEALKIYNRAYKTHYARCKKGRMSQTEFQVWCDAARDKLSQVRDGELDIVSFQKWLKQ